MRVALRFRRAVMANCWGFVATIRVDCLSFGLFYIRRGLRQSCARSGSLWALAFEVALRLFAGLVDAVLAMVVVYADDAVVSTMALAETRRRIFRTFAILEPALGTAINRDKTKAASCYV